MKIFVAIAGYDWTLHFKVVRALLEEQVYALCRGHHFSVNFVGGNAGIVQARNQLATQFMDSDFDRLVFLDADVTFQTGDLVKIAEHPVDFVGGAYRYKHGEEQYPVAWLSDPDKKGVPMIRCGLLEVAGVPTGFMSLSRKVFQTMIDKNPDRGLTNQCGHKSYGFFQMPIIDGHLYGEDFFFCREWSELGGKIYLDHSLNLTHWSFVPTPYQGNVGDWLNKGLQEKKEQINALP